MIDKEDLRQKISFEDFYSNYFPGEKKTRNKEWRVLCPFHAEKTPSMDINIENGMFFCHGCEAEEILSSFIKNKQGCRIQNQ